LTFLTTLQISIPPLPSDFVQLLIWIIILVVIGLIIIAILGFLFAFPIAALAAILVWFLSGGDLFWAAVAFLIVALISAAIGRIWRTTYHSHSAEHTHGEIHEHSHDHEHEV
jgi:membrane protein implicated in regulation of membrane protease activity